MGSVILDMERLVNFFSNPDIDANWENSEIDKFVKSAFSIGLNTTIEDVFEKDIGLVQLYISYLDFFSLSQNEFAISYFNRFMENEEDFDDILFDLAENNFDDFFKLYQDSFKSKKEAPKKLKDNISLSDIETQNPFAPIDERRYEAASYSYYERDNSDIDFDAILNEIEEKLSFANKILNQLKSNRNLGQDNLSNTSLKEIIRTQIDKNKQDRDFSKLNFLENLFEQSTLLKIEADKFFKEDYSRTKYFFEKTVNELQHLKASVLDFRSNEFDKRGLRDLNLNFSAAPAISDKESTEDYINELNKAADILRSVEGQTSKPTLEKLTKKLGISLNRDIYNNSFAVSRITDYSLNIKKAKSEILPIIEEWNEE